MPTYYVYRHIREDLNVPFYIGIGTINENPKYNTDTQIYNRAYKKNGGRNSYWDEIVDNTQYTVDILIETDDLLFANKKEDEFIQLYGKMINNTGTLVNIDNGGTFNKGKHRSTILKHSVSVYAYKYTGEFFKKYDVMMDAVRELNVSSGNICDCATKNKGVFGGYQFFYNYMGETVPTRVYNPCRLGRSIYIIDIKSKKIVDKIKSITEYKNKFKKGQRTSYNILENGLTINGMKHCFKDKLPNEYK